MTDVLPSARRASATIDLRARPGEPAVEPRPLETAPARTHRLVSLDAFRGLIVLAMILVENQGHGGHAFPGMAHAQWNGFTPADLVFPAFLFIVGASLACALAKHEHPWGAPAGLYRRVASRTAKLFALGLVLSGLGRVDLGTLHVMGVLQRIGLCYALAALLIVHAPVRRQVLLAATIVLGYWAFLTFFPVPHHGTGVLTPDGNAAGFVDRLVIGVPHLYRNGPYDPEGLASTLPALVTVLAGYWTGRHVRDRDRSLSTTTTLVRAGFALSAAALVWSLWYPLNKRLWTGSFTLLTAGLSVLAFAAVYHAIEVRGRVRWAFPFVVFGLNAIFVYVASELLGGWLDTSGVRSWLYRHVFSLAGLHVGSMLYALTTAAVWWVVLWAMYRRRWFVKV